MMLIISRLDDPWLCILIYSTGTGELLTSGWNCRGQLGLGDTEDRTILCPVEGLPPVNCIACGWNHNLAITGV